MSNRARDWAWAQAVTPTQKLVLLSLAEHANDQGGSCFPCGATLRGLTGLSERAIRKALRELEALDLIDCQHGRGKTSSRYRLHVSEGHEVPVTESRGAPDAGQRGTRCPRNHQ